SGLGWRDRRRTGYCGLFHLSSLRGPAPEVVDEVFSFFEREGARFAPRFRSRARFAAHDEPVAIAGAKAGERVAPVAVRPLDAAPVLSADEDNRRSRLGPAAFVAQRSA